MSKSDNCFFPAITDTSSLLIVEGSDDKEVVGAILKVHDMEPGFAVSVEEGIRNLKYAFSSRLKSTNTLKKLWVIADADSDCNAKWQMLRDCMIANGSYDVTPKSPLPKDGAIFASSDENGITVGIWIMPDNDRPGMLEDFIASLTKENDTLIGHAVSKVHELDGDRASHPALFKHAHIPKATIHTWLAWQDVPGRSIGTAILKHKIDFSAPLCRTFLEWLGKLQPGD